MTTPSTSDSKDAGSTVRPVAEKGAVGPSSTHAVVKGELSPRLPHERDQSSDSGTVKPNDRMKKAAEEAQDGHTDVPRGPATQAEYSELTEEAAEPHKPT
ncbi:MAG TPA: hypothetical protein VK439_11980 [Rubrivivax sp.]|nr:hypothetical protein [Rubrivivax sp.]